MNHRVLDESIELAPNAMLKYRSELFHQWNFEKNTALGLDVYKITKGSNKIAWWKCNKCKSDYDMKVFERTGRPNRSGKNCPYCSGMRVNHTNSLATLNPNLSSEWHPIRNGGLTPHDVVRGHNGLVWWLGKCGHEWDATVNSRTNMKSGCPYCANYKTLKGFNDMWTTNPELAKLLADPEDGYKYMQSASARVDWKCIQCENIIKDIRIDNVKHFNLSCPRCSDGVRFPEKFLYSLLNDASIIFEYDKSQGWSGLSRYDFYLPEYNWIIEVHGRQHYEDGFRGIKRKARTLEEEQENDKFKEELAKANGISNYVIIDARESTVEWLKNSVLNSDMMQIIEGIDFEKIGQLASNSFVKTASDMWNSGVHSPYEIGEKMKLNSSTILRYLKRGAEIGWCDYSVKVSKEASIKKSGLSRRKKIVQLDMEMNIIHSWDSLTEAVETLNISNGNISSVCRGVRKVAGGFKWMYKEEYDMLNLPKEVV